MIDKQKQQEQAAKALNMSVAELITQVDSSDDTLRKAVEEMIENRIDPRIMASAFQAMHKTIKQHLKKAMYE